MLCLRGDLRNPTYSHYGASSPTYSHCGASSNISYILLDSSFWLNPTKHPYSKVANRNLQIIYIWNIIDFIEKQLLNWQIDNFTNPLKLLSRGTTNIPPAGDSTNNISTSLSSCILPAPCRNSFHRVLPKACKFFVF